VVQLKVTIKNDWNLESDYMVTVTGFGTTVAPVAAQFKTINENQTATLTFDVRSSVPFTGGELCLIQMLSPNGKMYNQIVNFAFPPPTP